ncbi:MAG: hypothetical protein H8E98_04760 [Bacteroidetes bacterium]|nr:hypothetical protein [Bacteroidota bacterium]
MKKLENIIQRMSLLLLVMCLFIHPSCKKENKESYILKVLTKEIEDISSLSAVVYGEIQGLGNGIIDYGHCWSINTPPTLNDSKTTFGQTSNLGEYSSSISNLSPNTTYYVRAYAFDGISYTYGEIKDFTTLNSTLLIQTPTNNEVLIEETEYIIKWTSTGIVQNVNIYYQLENGNWHEIVTNYQNNGSYNWLTPTISVNVDLVSDSIFLLDCKIKIISSNDPDIFVISNSFELQDINGNWVEDVRLFTNSSAGFAGIYEYNNLTISDNVEITSYNISQLIIKVNETFNIGNNVTIRVRNGYYYYDDEPTKPLEYVVIVTGSNYKLYDHTYGIGGNGGNASSGQCGGGGGGFGGGNGGLCLQSQGGQPGQSNGGNGGLSIWGASQTAGIGGKNNKVGGHGSTASGGGGNGGYTIGHNNGFGGGGGGYGGGIFTLIAGQIYFNSYYHPKFLVSGQKGGSSDPNNEYAGQDGQGGLLIIDCTNYSPNSSHWNLNNSTYGQNNYFSDNGGHGVVTGNPFAVYVNGIKQ